MMLWRRQIQELFVGFSKFHMNREKGRKKKRIGRRGGKNRERMEGWGMDEKTQRDIRYTELKKEGKMPTEKLKVGGNVTRGQ
jgi:hypothetical protein